MPPIEPKLTFFVDMRGGQGRLRELILYVSKTCAKAERFGHIKLNKILWKADFDAFAARRVPVTGRRYQREKFGPVPKEMVPVHRDMIFNGSIRIEHVDFGDDVIEHRTIAIREPDLSLFSPSDISFVDGAIKYYWHLTGMEASDDSHGVAWKSRSNGDGMPYELAFLSDASISPSQMNSLQRLAFTEGWTSD